MIQYLAPIRLAMLALLALLLTACGEAAPAVAPPAASTATAQAPLPPPATATTLPAPPTAIPATPTAPSPAKVLVDTAWVKANLGAPGVRLIDVSSEKSVYDAGHLPGAQYMHIIDDLTDPDDPVRGQILQGAALEALLRRLGVANTDTVVLYDNTKNLDAARAYWVLKYYQHPQVRIYNGGRAKWLGDGETLTSEIPPLTPSQYQVGAPDLAIRTTWDYVVNSIGKEGTLFCDTRSQGEYTGASNRSAQGGHIPGAILVEWTQALRADGTFRDGAELRTLYEGAGFVPDKEIITYCQIGVRAAHTWFVLHELLGYPNVRVYDGSWEEYGNKPESPIER